MLIILFVITIFNEAIYDVEKILIVSLMNV